MKIPNKLKNIKWFTVVGSLINITLSIILFSFIAIALENNTTSTQVTLFYQIIISILSIDLIFSLLLISMSFQLNQIYYRLKWVNILVIIASAFSLILISVVKTRYGEMSENIIEIKSPLIYIFYSIAAILILVDPIILMVKFKNNPFYHNGKYKKTYTEYVTKDQNNHQNQNNNETKVEVLDENLSYFEIYERRSQELKHVEDLFDNGEIDENEYNRRRKQIYDKYDRYN